MAIAIYSVVMWLSATVHHCMHLHSHSKAANMSLSCLMNIHSSSLLLNAACMTYDSASVEYLCAGQSPRALLYMTQLFCLLSMPDEAKKIKSCYRVKISQIICLSRLQIRPGRRGQGVGIYDCNSDACQQCFCRLVSGTSLVAVVSTALASSYTYLSHGVVDTAAALLISCCAVLTAPLGANLTATLDALVSFQIAIVMHDAPF